MMEETPGLHREGVLYGNDRTERGQGKPSNGEVHTTEVVCFLWREAQPASLTLRSHARMSTCHERQPGTALLRPQKPATNKQRGRYVMPNAPSPKTWEHPKLARRYGQMKSQQPPNEQMSPKNSLRASSYEQATPHRLIKSAKTQRLRAEQAGTLADNAPKSSEDKRAFRKSNNKRI